MLEQCLCWESKQQRTVTLENSHQSHEQVNKKRKKERTQDLTRFDNLPTFSGQERERALNQLHVTNIGDNIPLYIAKEATKKRKSKTPNSDQKRILNQI